MRNQVKPFHQMTTDEQRKHKSLHGLSDRLWREGNTLWKQQFGERTFIEVHDNDHNYKRNDFAHDHTEKVGEHGNDS